MNKDTAFMLSRLQSLGISWDDALALRKVAMTLSNWHMLACNVPIERDEKGIPHVRGKRIADKEKGAHKRLAAIMAKHPALIAYVQSDPRGAPLYIVKRSDLEGNLSLEEYYTRGIAVFK